MLHFEEMIFPELIALKDVPQPEKWHPEGDAYQHTMLVKRVQEKLFPDDEILGLCAYCHDLGKALTPKDNWPKHYGHADLGIKPTRDLLERIGETEDVIRRVAFVTKYHMHIHNTMVMNHKTYIKIYNAAVDVCADNCGSISQLIELLAHLGVCDHYGRGNINPNEYYPHPFIFRNILFAIDDIMQGERVTLKDDFNRIQIIVKGYLK